MLKIDKKKWTFLIIAFVVIFIFCYITGTLEHMAEKPECNIKEHSVDLQIRNTIRDFASEISSSGIYDTSRKTLEIELARRLAEIKLPEIYISDSDISIEQIYGVKK